MDPDEAAEDVVFRERITHAIFVHVESFTGAMIPLRQIIRNLRKVRKDVSICVDNRSGYCLHPMPQLDEVVDYSVFPFLHTDSPDPRDQQVGGIPLFRIHGGAPSRHPEQVLGGLRGDLVAVAVVQVRGDEGAAREQGEDAASVDSVRFGSGTRAGV